MLDPVDYDGSADIIKEIQDRDIPVILFDAPTPEGSGLTSVGNDFAEQARQRRVVTYMRLVTVKKQLRFSESK